jgi:hypothetical protein
MGGHWEYFTAQKIRLRTVENLSADLITSVAIV